MDEPELIAGILLLMAVMIWLARAGALPRSLAWFGKSAARAVEENPRQALQRSARQLRAHYLGRETLFPDLLREAEARFDPEILMEMQQAAREEAEMWVAFNRQFGGPLPEMSPAHHSFTDPVLAASMVRHMRALDEQLARRNLKPADKPDNWVSFYASGRIPLPAPAWEQAPAPSTSEPAASLGQFASAPLDDGDKQALEPLLAILRNHRQARPLTALLISLTRKAKGLDLLEGRGLVPVPAHTGSHRNYELPDWPWDQPYLHVFAREPVAGDQEADLLLSWGCKGHTYHFAALLCEPAARGKARSRRESRIRDSGYDCFRFDPDWLAEHADEAADRILARLATMLGRE